MIESTNLERQRKVMAIRLGRWMRRASRTACVVPLTALVAALVVVGGLADGPRFLTAAVILPQLFLLERSAGTRGSLALLALTLWPLAVLWPVGSLLEALFRTPVGIATGLDLAGVPLGALWIISRNGEGPVRRYLLVALTVLTINIALYSLTIASTTGAVAAVLGWLLSIRGVRGPRPSRTRDTRTSLTIAGLSLGLGPMVGLFVSGLGPLWPLTQFVSGAMGQEPAGIGPAAPIVPIAAVACFVAAACGLARGSRIALVSAVVLSLEMSAHAVTMIVSAVLRMRPDQTPRDIETVRDIVGASLCAAVLCGYALLLFRARAHFRARMPRQVQRVLWPVVLGTASVAIVAVTTLPGDERTLAVVFATGLLGLTAILVTNAACAPRMQTYSAPEGFRLLHHRNGRGYSGMGTWAGTKHWMTEDRSAGISYRVSKGVSVSVGGVVGNPARRDEAIEQYSSHCIEQGWMPVLYGVDESTAAMLNGRGWEVQVVGEEARIDVHTWSTSGRSMQDVRTSVNRASRAGVTYQLGRFTDFGGEARRAIVDLCAGGARGRALPEMKFTLGGSREIRDEDTRIAAAIASDGGVLAVTSWLPEFDEHQEIAWILDVMRRRPSAPNGTMEALIAFVISEARTRDVATVSLSATPLIRSDGTPTIAGTESIVALGEKYYGFTSLMKFKRKFQPRQEQIWVAYQSAANLPLLSAALLALYLPGMRLSRLLQYACRPSSPEDQGSEQASP